MIAQIYDFLEASFIENQRLNGTSYHFDDDYVNYRLMQHDSFYEYWINVKEIFRLHKKFIVYKLLGADQMAQAVVFYYHHLKRAFSQDVQAVMYWFVGLHGNKGTLHCVNSSALLPELYADLELNKYDYVRRIILLTHGIDMGYINTTDKGVTTFCDMSKQCMTVEEAVYECDEDVTPLFFDHELQECMIAKVCDEVISLVPCLVRPDRKCEMVRALLRVPNCSTLKWFLEYGSALCGDKVVSDYVYAKVMQVVSESISSMEKCFYQHFDYQLEIRHYLLGQCPIYYRGIEAVRSFSRMIQLIDDDRVFLWVDLEPHWPFLRNFPKMIRCGDKVWYDKLALKTYAGWIPNDDNDGIIQALGEEKVFDVCVYALDDGISKCREEEIFNGWLENLNILDYMEEFVDVTVQELFVKFMFSHWIEFERLCSNLRIVQLRYVDGEMAWDGLRHDDRRLVSYYSCVMVASGMFPIDIIKIIISHVMYKLKFNPRLLKHLNCVTDGEYMDIPAEGINRFNNTSQMYSGYDDDFGRCKNSHRMVWLDGNYEFRDHCCRKHCFDLQCKPPDVKPKIINSWKVIDIEKYNCDGIFIGCDEEILNNVMIDHICESEFCHMCRTFDVDFVRRDGCYDTSSGIICLDDVG